ncbi:MAG: hypothetical protein J5I90_15705 [Caldilineales bacterium]|nr:hypothetical protein [Caldilineales bacterium]
MNANLIIATTGNGIARAERQGDGSWLVSHLLGGQDVRCLAADPLNREVIYAGTQGAGVQKSLDGGVTWATAGLDKQIVKSIAPSPHTPGLIYAGTKPPYLFVSTDDGANWREMEGFRKIRFRRLWFSPAESPGTAYVQGLALSPSDPNVILAGIEFGAVVRSENGGETWSGHRKGALRDCHSLIFHHHDGDWAYEGGGANVGVACSRDGGKRWRQPSEGFGHRYGWAVAADGLDPTVWYVSAGNFAWKGVPQVHIDGKANAWIWRKRGDAPWERLAGGLPQPLDYMAYSLQTDPDEGGYLYVGLSNGQVWFSGDYGDNWQQLPIELGRVGQMLVL